MARSSGSIEGSATSCHDVSQEGSIGSFLLYVLFGLLLVGFGWLCLGRRDEPPEPTAHRRVREDIDYAELEQAEREVREALDEDSVRDWGPGSGRPPTG